MQNGHDEQMQDMLKLKSSWVGITDPVSVVVVVVVVIVVVVVLQCRHIPVRV